MSSMNKKHCSSEKAVLFHNNTARACIILSDKDDCAEREAAKELAKYLSLITGFRFPCCIGSPCEGLLPITVGSSILASKIMKKASLTLSGQGEEAFAVAVTKDGIALQGRRGRSTFYAIYAFLEMLGCAFLEPGGDGEVVPRKNLIEVCVGGVIEKPRLSYRNIHIDCSAWAGTQHTIDIIEWTLKNRGNMVEIVPFHMDDARLIEHLSLLLKEIKKRDLIASFGGHGVGMFFMLPEDCLFPGTQPRDWDDFIRLLNKTRRDDPDLFGGESSPIEQTNGEPLFCMANPRAISRFVNNLTAFLRNYPEIDVIRFGQNDLCRPCACEKCATDYHRRYFQDLLPRIDLALKRHFPDKRFIHMLQGQGDILNTQEADWMHFIAPVQPFGTDIPVNGIFKNIILCKGNEDFDCRGDITEPCNQLDFSMIQEHKRLLGENHYVTKELYSSGLYNRIPFWCPRVVWRNTRYYTDHLSGYIGSHVFMNSSHFWRLWSPNLYTFLASLWDPDLDIDRFLDHYISKAYAGAKGLGRRIFRFFEEYGTKVAVLTRACSFVNYDQSIQLEMVAEAKIRDSSSNWAEILEMCVREGEALIEDMDNQINEQPEGFLKKWLCRDRVCLDRLLAFSRLRLQDWKSLRMNEKDQTHWDPDWTEKLTSDAKLSRAGINDLERLMP